MVMDSTSILNQALGAAQSAWVGCDWDTEFGDRKQNLRGLRSRQAKLAAQATRGAESIRWWAACRFLERIEQDARVAASLAAKAVAQWQRGDLVAALNHLDQAIELESNYHPPQVYPLLRQRMVQVTQPTANSP